MCTRSRRARANNKRLLLSKRRVEKNFFFIIQTNFYSVFILPLLLVTRNDLKRCRVLYNTIKEGTLRGPPIVREKKEKPSACSVRCRSLVRRRRVAAAPIPCTRQQQQQRSTLKTGRLQTAAAAVAGACACATCSPPTVFTNTRSVAYAAHAVSEARRNQSTAITFYSRLLERRGLC